MNSINETTFIINAQASTDGVIGTLILTRDPEKNKIVFGQEPSSF